MSAARKNDFTAKSSSEPANDISQQQWLTLGEASDFLGVHFSTLRVWADRGEIRVFRTPGGHRRFSAADLRRFLEERVNQASLPNGDALMESALGLVRREMEKLSQDSAAWRSNLSEQERRTKQERGRQLFALALNYVLKPGQRDRLLEDGRTLGTTYGQEAAASGVSLAETGRAVQFFRNQLMHAILGTDVRSTLDAEDVRIQNVIEHFLDEVLYAVLDGYEQALRGA